MGTAARAGGCRCSACLSRRADGLALLLLHMPLITTRSAFARSYVRAPGTVSVVTMFVSRSGRG